MSNRNCTNSRVDLLKDNQISSSMTIKPLDTVRLH
jgi:hypothetical protein